ncbi:CHAP domain-containing protein [Clostridium gasigenes]|uniref:CHAP domain-containing protein n=1 Tax=Clostridium gasigenes TaxID=94869 RepID=UPI001C0BE0AB|nr:CHAP domain-containing protein [Clostridium gasigenes]MBU3135528.1 CHAP domain-containing protein [Clostridium gasigenes]
MKNKLRKIFLAIIIITVIGCGVHIFTSREMIGTEIDSYSNVPVYYNGKIYTETYGENYGEDGYYYGYEWQCVEYVKRFYHQIKDHKMPDVYGNAKEFFDDSVPQGELNKSRDLVQYRNGESVKPEADDLIVFTNSKYGHVAIVTEVKSNYIEVIQQNVYGKTREQYELVLEDGQYYVGTIQKPAGWLRKG